MDALIIQALENALASVKNGGGFRSLDWPPSPDKIKSIRVGLDMTQAEFAQYVGVSVNTVKSWETGRRSPGKMSSAIFGSKIPVDA